MRSSRRRAWRRGRRWFFRCRHRPGGDGSWVWWIGCRRRFPRQRAAGLWSIERGSGRECARRGDEHGVEGDDGFSAADIALEETAHGFGGLDVGGDFPDSALLGFGQLKGEAGANAL